MDAAGDLIARMLALQAEETGQDPEEILAPRHHHDATGEARRGDPDGFEGVVSDG